jgi:hypothetical protein
MPTFYTNKHLSLFMQQHLLSPWNSRCFIHLQLKKSSSRSYSPIPKIEQKRREKEKVTRHGRAAVIQAFSSAGPFVHLLSEHIAERLSQRRQVQGTSV